MIRRRLGAHACHHSATGRSVALALAACGALLAGACSSMDAGSSSSARLRAPAGAAPAAFAQPAYASALKPLDATHDNPSWGWTAGAGISTAEDLARYVQAFVGGGLLSDAMQKQRLASIHPIDPADPKSPGYGLALAQFGPVFGHTGELPGYNSFMGHDPRRSITIIVWSSLAAAPDGRAPTVEMAKVIIGHLYGGQIP